MPARAIARSTVVQTSGVSGLRVLSLDIRSACDLFASPSLVIHSRKTVACIRDDEGQAQYPGYSMRAYAGGRAPGAPLCLNIEASLPLS